MKITHLFAAALMVAGIGVSTDASAQRYDGNRYEQNDRGNRGYDRREDRRYDRRDYRRDDRRGFRGYRHDNRRWDRGNRWGRNNGWRGNNRCRIVYRHHRRYTVCG